MAYPPPTQATSRTNATPQLDLHAADHNSLAQAINDTVGHIQTAVDPVTGAAQTRMPLAYTATGGGGTCTGPEIGVCSLSGAAVTRAGVAMIWSMHYITKTVPTDVFRIELRAGVTLLQTVSGDSGNGPQAQFDGLCSVDVGLAGAIGVQAYLIRSSGTGSATFYSNLNRINVLFIPIW